MTVVITGGCGFLGGRLAAAIEPMSHLLLPDGTELLRPRIVLADRPGASVPPELDGKVEVRPLDVTDRKAVEDALGDAQAVFHLAAVVSGQAEAELDLGLAVNLDGTRNVLEALAGRGRATPLITTSSLAVFGENVSEPLTEATPTQPRSSYGAQKAIAEILLSDYRRRGLVEARVLRLPTIIVRPGAPNAAASSFASSLFREPLAGQDALCPVDPGLEMWVASPQTAIQAMLRALSVPSDQWPGFAAINVPGVTAKVAQMLEALRVVGGDAARAHVRLDPDPAIEAIVSTWPARFDTSLAADLGMTGDESIEGIVRAYLEAREV